MSEDVRKDAVQIAMKASTPATLACVNSFAKTDFRGDLAKIDVPTLVIHGDSDGVVPFEVSGKRTAATVAGAQLVVVEDGPHRTTPRTPRSSTTR